MRASTFWSAIAAVAAVAAAALPAYQALYAQKEYDISVRSCGEKGPEKVFLTNTDTGYRVQLPTGDVPNDLTRVTRIRNDGSKVITDQSISVSLNNPEKTKILSVMVFYDNPLSRHQLIANQDGDLFLIKLKDFTPGEAINFVTDSERAIGVNVAAKGPNVSVNEHIERTSTCLPFTRMGYSGIIAYNKTDPGCQTDPKSLDLKCSLKQGYTIPKDFPPGPASITFE